MVEKFKEKFRALIEDYKVTKNDNEDFVWWYVQRVAPFNLRYVIAAVLVLCMAAIYFNIKYALTTVLVLWVIAVTITIVERVYRKRKQKQKIQKNLVHARFFFFTYPQEEISGAISEELFEKQREQDYNLNV